MKSLDYPKQRQLDTLFHCIDRNGIKQEIAFTDLTQKEQLLILDSMDEINIKNHLITLAETLRAYGDLFNISMNNE